MVFSYNGASKPMSTAHFIAWGPSAVGALKQRDRLLGQSNPIVEVVEDLRMGPLDDADQVVAPKRTFWWQAIWRAQWWFDGDAYETALLDQYAGCRAHFLSVIAAPEPQAPQVALA